MSTNSPTAALSEAGVSIWLDDLSRERITSGGLEQLIAERNVVGVTTNPTIFAGALAKGDAYHDAAARARRGRRRRRHARSSRSRPTTCATRPTSSAPSTTRSGGYDGRVSIEVAPDLAHDTGAHDRAGASRCGRRSTGRT